MWLHWVSVILLCAHISCAVLSQVSILRSDGIPFGDDEGMSDGYLRIARIQTLQLDVEKQLDTFHEYVSSKMDKLVTACQKPAATKTSSFEYTESTGFKEPRMNRLVELMTEQMRGIADIIMDDLERISHNISNLIAEGLQEKFPLLEGDFGDIHSLIEGLAKKEALNQLKTTIGTVVSSSIIEVREHVRKMASKPELVAVTQDLANSNKHLQEVTLTMSTCAESTALIENALPKVTQSARQIADVKQNWMNTRSSFNCSETPVQLLTSLESAAKGRKDQLTALSQTLQKMDDGVSTQLDELTLILKVAYELQSPATSSPPPPPPISPILLTPDEQHSLTTAKPDEPECLDSTFVSSTTARITPPNICKSAVRLQNCHSEFASFHCCRTCRRAGYVFPVPNIGASRQVPLLEALRSVMPSFGAPNPHQFTNPISQQFFQSQTSLKG